MEVINFMVLYHSTIVACLRKFLLYLARLKLVETNHLKIFLDFLRKFLIGNRKWEKKTTFLK